MSIHAQRARSIFIRAVEQFPPDQWETYLDNACRENVALRQYVERLLHAHQGDDSFLDRGEDDGSALTGVAEAPGDRIGRYKIVEQVGEGGMGVVYLAEQEQPVRRQVALKVIKPGMDTREVIGRFEAERQALAMMDHAGIAKVFDAGTTDGGRPFFVMELVQGVPITEYCDQCELTTRERLELFILVCQAVQHAHQKGIIHRDLKPTNVLVARSRSCQLRANGGREDADNARHLGREAGSFAYDSDDGPVLKIIDFGVAKAIGARLTEHTLTTGDRPMVGTPMYMSPEQAELSPLGVDTRADVYALGVLLYELLTGATPFDKGRLHAADSAELRRIIREEEPPRPSARISTLSTDLATTIAGRRAIDRQRLVQLVRGDLDWIVMKCLEKDRNRRYESVSALAQDVQRHLDDEPIEACPPSATYRLKKFARRNRRGVFATAAVVAAAALAVTGLAMHIDRLAEANVSLVEAVDKEQQANYLQKIALAHLEYRTNNLARAQELLEECPREMRGWEWDYMNRLCHAHARKVPLRVGNLYSPQFSAEARVVAALAASTDETGQESDSGRVLVWDANTGAIVLEAPIPSRPSFGSSLALRSDGQQVAVPFRTEVRTWDVATGKELPPLRATTAEDADTAHGEGFTCVAFSPDGRWVAAGDQKGGVILWDAASAKRVFDIPAHPDVTPEGLDGFTGAVAFTPDGELLLSAGNNDGTIRVWKSATGEPLKTLEVPLGSAFGMTLSPDGTRMAATTQLGVLVWDTSTWELESALRGQPGLHGPVAFSPNGQKIVTGEGVGAKDRDDVLRVWDVESGLESREYRSPTGNFIAVAYTADGTQIASAVHEDAVLFWDTTRDAEVLTFEAETQSWSMDFTADGRFLVTAGLDTALRVWDVATGKAVKTLSEGRIVGWGMADVSCSPAEPLVACIQEGNADQGELLSVEIWNVETGQRVRSFFPQAEDNQPVQMQAVEFSPDGKHLYTGGLDGRIRVYDVKAGTQSSSIPLPAPADQIEFLQFSGDGRRLLSVSSKVEENGGSGPADIIVWDARTQQKLASFHASLLWKSAAISANGELVAVPEEGRVRLYDAATGEEKGPGVLAGVTLNSTVAAISPDGRRIATGGGPNPWVVLWDTRTGQQILTLGRHQQPGRGSDAAVVAIAFSPDGRRLVSTNFWGAINVWDTTPLDEQTKQPLASYD